MTPEREYSGHIVAFVDLADSALHVTTAQGQKFLHRCPFAQRAWITLVEKRLNFEHKIVDLQNKPKHFKDLYASIHPDPTAPAKVPIIIGESRMQLVSMMHNACLCCCVSAASTSV